MPGKDLNDQVQLHDITYYYTMFFNASHCFLIPFIHSPSFCNPISGLSLIID